MLLKQQTYVNILIYPSMFDVRTFFYLKYFLLPLFQRFRAADNIEQLAGNGLLALFVVLDG